MRRDIGIGLFLAAAVAAVYRPVGRFEFVHFDDTGYVVENPHVRQGLTWAKTLADAIGDRLELYRSGRSCREPPIRPREAHGP